MPKTIEDTTKIKRETWAMSRLLSAYKANRMSKLPSAMRKILEREIVSESNKKVAQCIIYGYPIDSETAERFLLLTGRPAPANQKKISKKKLALRQRENKQLIRRKA